MTRALQNHGRPDGYVIAGIAFIVLLCLSGWFFRAPASGVVVSKQFTPAHTELEWNVVLETIMPVYYTDKWTITYRGTNASGVDVTSTFEVSEREYAKYRVGQKVGGQ